MIGEERRRDVFLCLRVGERIYLHLHLLQKLENNCVGYGSKGEGHDTAVPSVLSYSLTSEWLNVIIL